MLQQIRDWVLKHLNIADIRPDAWDKLLIRETVMEEDVKHIKTIINDVPSKLFQHQMQIESIVETIAQLQESSLDIEALAPVISADKAVEEAKPEIKPIKAVKKRVVKKTTKG